MEPPAAISNTEPPAAYSDRLSALLLFQQLSQHSPKDAIVNDDKQIFSTPSPPPIRCSSRPLCSGSTELLVTSTLPFQQMRRYWKTLREQDQDYAVSCRPRAAWPVKCSEDGECSSYLGTTKELPPGTVSTPLPFQHLFQDPPHDDEETVPTYFLRAPVQECSGMDHAGSDEQFAALTSIEETNFNEAQSLLVCNRRS